MATSCRTQSRECLLATCRGMVRAEVGQSYLRHCFALQSGSWMLSGLIVHTADSTRLVAAVQKMTSHSRRVSCGASGFTRVKGRTGQASLTKHALLTSMHFVIQS